MRSIASRTALAIFVFFGAAWPLSAQRTLLRAPTVTGAIPARVSVAPGEAPVTVELEGTNLLALDQISVLQGGRPVRDVQAAFGRTRSSTRRPVQLSVRSGSSVSGPLQVVVSSSSETVSITIPSRVLTLEVAAAVSPPSVTVTGASSSELFVRPGSTENVTIEGTNLDRIQGAIVQRNGAPVSQLTATLLGSADPTRRSVRLTAGSGTSGPVNEPLQLVLEDSQSGESHTVPIEVGIGVPDLKVIVMARRGDDVRGTGNELDLIIGNYGRVDAVFPAGSAVVEIDASPLPPVFWVAEQQLRVTYENGAPKYGVSVPGQLPYGTFEWTLKVDPGNLVAETNEGNNEERITVSTEQPALPDLIISDIATMPPHPEALKLYDLLVTVRNVGAVPYLLSDFPARVEVESCAATFSHGPSKDLLPGESATLVVKAMPPLATAGWHECRFKVESTYPESDESNNELVERWYVNPS